ncbi:MAG: exosortase/archaeosortase family protein, partial [Nitrososphaerota archaeon]|nr:exosortase/archaeosortase family protein [Nitrososphaerota archaeon]
MQVTKSSAMAQALNDHKCTLLKFLVIAIAVIAIYFQDLNIIFRGALTSESAFHIIAIPFLFAFLVYRKRKMVNASLMPVEDTRVFFKKYFSLIIGVVLCAVAMLTYWYGSYSFMPLEFHMVTLPFLAAGLILILFNPQTLKHLFFPVSFLVFLTPPPSELLFGVGSTLAELSAVVSNALVNVCGIHATLSSSTVGPVITILRPDSTLIPFNVGVACSGIYSLIGFTIFALFIAYITAGKLFTKLFLFALGIPFMILLNILRITVILAIGYHYGETLALELFHSMGATIFMFIGVFILLGMREKVVKKPPPLVPCPECVSIPPSSLAHFCSTCGKVFKHPKINLTKLDITKIAGILIVTMLLLSIQAPTFALTEGPAEVLSQTSQGLQVDGQSIGILPDIDGYTLRYSYRDTSYEQITGNDAAMVYVYNPIDKSNLSIWVAIQVGPSVIDQHRWETCLINVPLSKGNAARVTQFDLRDIRLQDNPPMTSRFFVFQYPDSNQIQAVLYWYQTATFSVDGTSQTKSVMISLITYLNSADMIEAAENQQLPVAQ